MQTFDASWAGDCRLPSGEKYIFLSLEVPENRSCLQPTSTKVTKSCSKLSNLKILSVSLLGGAFLMRPSDLLHLVYLHVLKTNNRVVFNINFFTASSKM